MDFKIQLTFSPYWEFPQTKAVSLGLNKYNIINSGAVILAGGIVGRIFFPPFYKTNTTFYAFGER